MRFVNFSLLQLPKFENFQILGVVKGKSLQIAKLSLLKNNPWITESGFNVEKLKQTLERQGVKRTVINLSLEPEGKHNEDQWGKEFPKALEWLFY